MTDAEWANYRELQTDETFEYGTRYPVSEAFESTNVAISVVEFAPGEAGPLQAHAEPVEEFYHIVRGSLDVRLDDEVVSADAGTIVYIPPNTKHKPINNSNEQAVLFSFMTPGEAIDERTEYFPE